MCILHIHVCVVVILDYIWDSKQHLVKTWNIPEYNNSFLSQRLVLRMSHGGGRGWRAGGDIDADSNREWLWAGGRSKALS